MSVVNISPHFCFPTSSRATQLLLFYLEMPWNQVLSCGGRAKGEAWVQRWGRKYLKQALPWNDLSVSYIVIMRVSLVYFTMLPLRLCFHQVWLTSVSVRTRLGYAAETNNLHLFVASNNR